MKKVGKEGFEAFINAYPRPLSRDVAAIYDPPLITYNDFERAPFWPESIAARHVAGSDCFEVLEDVNAPVVTTRQPETGPLFDKNGAEVKAGDEVRVLWNSEMLPNGQWSDTYKIHTIVKTDVGTPYERWGITGCANCPTGLNFEKVS